MMALIIILGGLGYWATSRLNRNVVQMSDDAIPGLIHIGQSASKMQRIRGDVWKHISLSDPAAMQKVETQIQAMRQDLAKNLSAYQRAITQAEDRSNFDRLKSAIDAYWSPLEDVLVLSRAQQTEQAVALYLKTIDPVFQRIVEELRRMEDWNARYSEAAARDAGHTVTTSNRILLATLFAALAIAFTLASFIIRTIRQVLSRTVDDLSATANGLSAASAQVASTSLSLAHGASQQAAGIEQVSAASEDVNSLSKQTASRAGNATQIVLEKQKQYDAAFEKIRMMSASVVEINEESEKISRIMRVIDEIAFQTNILALNAAVEAARAGEAGQGFAVVADEVRSLSQRCAQAAHDTSSLIEHSIQIAAQGKLHADSVVSAVEDLHRRAFDIQAIVSEISAASLEQTKGIESISGSLTDLDRQTQNTAAASEQGSAAAQQLSAQAEAMRASIHDLALLAQ